MEGGGRVRFCVRCVRWVVEVLGEGVEKSIGGGWCVDIFGVFVCVGFVILRGFKGDDSVDW